MANKLSFLRCSMLAAAACLAPAMAHADALTCPVTYAQLKSALVAADKADSSGFANHYWGVVVNRQGVVCAVAYSGATTASQWLGSRQIASAKAFTANAFSLNKGDSGAGLTTLSTAELYRFVQPSNASVFNPLYDLDGGNVQDATIAYQGSYSSFGTTSDPMIGYRVGGTITFGGGLALVSGTTVVGGLGLSGDTACSDHSTAWRTRTGLGLAPSPATDQLPFSTNSTQTDGHPHCPFATKTNLAPGSFTGTP